MCSIQCRILTFGLLWSLLPVPGIVANENGPLVRELYVPFEDLDVVLKGGGRRVFLTRAEYDELVAKASVSTEAPPPTTTSILSSRFAGRVDDGRATLRGTVVIDVTANGVHAVPMHLQGVGLLSATLGGEPASISEPQSGLSHVFVEGKGRHSLELEIVLPVAVSAAEQTLEFRLPSGGAGGLKLAIPGNVEVKSGLVVARRSFDGRETQLELLPQANKTKLVLSLNDDEVVTDQLVVARTVLVDEVTEAYEKLHVTASMQIPHGAVDRFQFSVPKGFEITDVATPMLASWQVVQDPETVLVVRLREPASGTQVLNISAQQNEPDLTQWVMPVIEPLDVAGTVGVVGLLVEERLEVESIVATGLIPIDAMTLTATLPSSVFEAEPGAPAITPIAAYFSPDRAYRIEAQFVRPPAELDVTSSFVLRVNESEQRLQGSIRLVPLADRLFEFSLIMESDWNIAWMNDGAEQLEFERQRSSDGESRVRVRLARGIDPEQTQAIQFEASRTPGQWLDGWDTRPLQFPKVEVDGATSVRGVIALDLHDDLEVEERSTTNLRPLDENEKLQYGLGGVPTNRAFLYRQGDYSAEFELQRVSPRMTAETYSFVKLEPSRMVTHFEIHYDVREARSDEFAFQLPLTTPAEIAIEGLQGVTIKESSSEDTASHRIWRVTLSSPLRGLVRLKATFEHPLLLGEAVDNDAAVDTATSLPVISALGVAYQTGAVAVEGSSELQVELATSARAVDIGEMIDATYQPGRRLLGAYGFVGAPVPVAARVNRPTHYGLPNAIIERAELVSAFSGAGVCQTAARMQLRSKAQFVEIQLPSGSTLWSAYLDGQPTKPQRNGERLLISIPRDASRQVRDLQLVYESEIAPIGMVGDLQVGAPKLFLQMDPESDTAPVPLADLKWNVALPAGYQMVSTDGGVYVDAPSAHGVSLPGELAIGRMFRDISKVQTEMAGNGIPSAARLEPVQSSSSNFSLPAPNDATVDFSGGTPFTFEAQADEEHADRRKLPQIVSGAVTNEQTPTIGEQAGEGGDGLAKIEAERESKSTNSRPGVAGNQQKLAEGRYWAMEGLRSLEIDIDVASAQTPIVFASLGETPVVKLRVIDYHRLELLAWGLAMAVFAVGLALLGQSRRKKFRYVLTVILVASVVPLLFESSQQYLRVMDLVFFSGVLLIPIYVGKAVLGKLLRRGATVFVRAPVAALLGLVFFFAVTASSIAQQATEAQVGPIRVKLLGPETPVEIPKDVVIVPYNPELGPSQEAGKVIVPYDKYIELWDLAFPDAKMTEPKLPASYAWAGGSWTATLSDADSIVLSGKLFVDSFSESLVAVPVELQGGVLEQAKLDGKPARLAERKPSEQPAPSQKVERTDSDTSLKSILLIDRKGRHVLQLAVRFPLARRGGWRVVQGRLPAVAASELTVTVPAENTEVRIPGGLGQGERLTRVPQEEIQTALASHGKIQLQWRPKVAQGTVDQSLTVRSDAVFDIQEDSLRLVSQIDYLFARATRDTCEFRVTPDYVVERVTGENLRSWSRTGDVVKVRLLNEARDRQRITVQLTKRGVVVGDDDRQFPVPIVQVPDAVLHEGRIALRRSPLLNVRVSKTRGVSRTDLASVEMAKQHVSDSPLGLRRYQAYRFSQTPFELGLTVRRADSELKVEVQSLFQLSEVARRLETRLLLDAPTRPVHRLTLVLPEGFRPEDVTAPGITHSSRSQKNGASHLTIYFNHGQVGRFSVVLKGEFDVDSLAQGNVSLPKVVVEEATEQTTMVVVQSDPGIVVRTQSLVDCSQVLLERAFGWLLAPQRRLSRVAVQATSRDFSGELALSPRIPRIACRTISNLRVTRRAFEETILLDFEIRDAGAREVSFLLPAEFRTARISAPLMRKKAIEDISEEQIRVRIELKDAVMGQLRVLVEDDRLVDSAERAVPIPIMETGEVKEQFVAIESAGRDEVVIARSNEVEPLGRQQSQWKFLASVLGEDVTQAYLVDADANAPLLVAHTRDRESVQTVGARIPLAETLLVVDEGGAFRGTQTYHVDNRTEQFLEVVLPQSAELWSAFVAGEPVKPSVGNSGVRLPLVKTAEGDQDYLVVLKYGGRLDGFSQFAKVDFPLMQTKNIKVLESQVRLRLPEAFRWFGFDGTMRHVTSESDLTAGYLQYKTQKLMEFTSGLASSNAYARLRCLNNIKSLVGELEGLEVDDRRGNAKLAQELESNRRALAIAKRQLEDEKPLSPGVLNHNGYADNNGRLNYFFENQSNARNTNLFDDLGSNFESQVRHEADSKDGDNATTWRRDGTARLQRDWVESNQLGNSAIATGRVDVEGRVNINKDSQVRISGAQNRFYYKENGLPLPSAPLGEEDAGQVTGRRGTISGMEGGMMGGMGSGMMGGGGYGGGGGTGDAGGNGEAREKRGAYGGGFAGRGDMSYGDDESAYYDSRSNRRGGGQATRYGVPSKGLAKKRSIARFNEVDRVQKFQRRLSQQSQPQRSVRSDGAEAYSSVALTPTPTNAPSSSTSATEDPFVLASEGGQTKADESLMRPVATGMASLDVNLPVRGAEFLFTTPRGDTQISARPISEEVVGRYQRLAFVVVTLCLVGLIYRFTSWVGCRWSSDSRPVEAV